MKKGKIIIVFSIVVAVLFMFYIGYINIKRSYLGMYFYVNNNYKELESKCNDNVCNVETDYYGSISEGAWIGYIYSKDDTPYYVEVGDYLYSFNDIEQVDDKTWKIDDETYIKQLNKNTWISKDSQDGSDNYTYIKRIRKNFFYYKIHF